MAARGGRRLGEALPAGGPELLGRAPQAIAQKVREMRKLLGLSQDDLARRAGTSQGAVSRVEAGACEEMTFRIIVGVFVALAVELLPMRDALSPELDAVIGVVTGSFPLLVEDQAFTVFRDPGLTLLVRGYTNLPPREQKRLVRVLGPLLDFIEPV